MRELDATQLDALFVQSAAAFASAGDEITLHGVADATVYFSDRPRREAGHLSCPRFLELWEAASVGFAASPPRAVLSFVAEQDTGSLEDVVLILGEPRLDGHDLTYGVEVVEGELPSAGGACSLFIDVLARPLAPSVTADAAEE